MIEVTGYRRGGVDPHTEKCKPGKELDDGQLFHGQGHAIQVRNDANQSAFSLPALDHARS